MTRTSSISGTFVNRQRSPVSVAAASSFRAAFLAPLIRTVPSSGRPPSIRRPRGRPARGSVLPVERPGVSHRVARRYRAPSRGAADPRDGAARRPGCAAAPAGARRGPRPGRRPRGSRASSARSASRRASWAFSRSISDARSAVSAITTTLSGRTWRKPPTIANDSSAPPLRIRSSPTPSVVISGAWCGRMPELALDPGQRRPSRRRPRTRGAPA